jgi:peroxin-6
LKLDALEIPKVSWDEVAGLTEVKSVLKTLMENVQKHPRPTGILLHGPPGTGKTLIAKALATQSRFTLLPVKGPELLSPYIGESESSLRETFARAKSLSPCIIFFDELDALVPRRGDFGDSVGVADRLVATLMIEMDKISGLNSSESDNFVFVIGATNRPDLIDPALLRTGRFDQSILLDAPKTNKERAEILEASCRKLRCAPSIDFATPFEELEAGGGTVENFSPAQIASIAKCASKLVLERKLGQFRSNPDETELLIDPLTTSDLVSAAKELYLKEKTSFIFKSN